MIERHRVKLPTKTKVSSGTISQKANRYYVLILVEEKCIKSDKEFSVGIGIDLGIKDFAVISNGMVKKNVNKTQQVKKTRKKLKR